MNIKIPQINLNKLMSAFTMKISRSMPAIYNMTFGGLMYPSSRITTNIIAYDIINTVSSCVNEIANNASQLPIEFFSVKTDEEEEDVTAESRFDVFKTPNSMQSGQSFIRNLAQHLLITGATYIEPFPAEGVPVSMYLHDSPDITIKLDKKGIAGYKERIGGDVIPWQPEELVCMMFQHPFRRFTPESPLDSLRSELQLEDSAITFSNNFFLNGATMSGVLEVPHELTDDNIKVYQEQFNIKHSGVRNAWRPLVVDSGSKWTNTGIATKDMQFLEQLALVDVRIAGKYGVPPVLIGILKGSPLGNAEIEKQMKLFWSTTMFSFMAMLCDMLSYLYLPRFANDNERLICKANFKGVKELQEDQTAQTDRSSKEFLSGGITLNEYRESIDREPMEDDELGELMIIPVNMVPLKDMLLEDEIIEPEEPEPEEETEEEAEEAEKWLTSYLKRITPEEAKDIRVLLDAILLDLDVSLKQFLAGFKSAREEQVRASIKRVEGFIGASITGITVATPEMQAVIRARDKFIAEITRTTNKSNLRTAKKAIQKAISDGLTKNQTIDLIASNIDAQFDKAMNIKKGRARLIAITETTSVSNGSQIAVMDIQGFKQKMWLSQRDAQVRDEHIMMDGESVGINESFSNGLDYPQEPNCRCDAIPVQKSPGKRTQLWGVGQTARYGIEKMLADATNKIFRKQKKVVNKRVKDLKKKSDNGTMQKKIVNMTNYDLSEIMEIE